MSEPNAPVNKADIIARITALRSSVDLQSQQREAIIKQAQETRKKKEQIQTVLRRIQEEHDAAREALERVTYERNQLDSKTKTESLELESLERELKRLHDKEAIDADYLARLEKFRNSCLDAPWRAENRTDGMGALPHQIEGAIELAVSKRAMLGDKRGLGKTLTSIIWLDFIGATKVIAISPSDTMDNYIREIKRWAPHRNVIKVGKMGKGERDFLLPVLKTVTDFILVLNYEAWRRDDKLIDDLVALKVDTVILDEAHHGKTMTTSTALGIQRLAYTPNECPQCGTDQIERESIFGDWTDNAVCQICGHESKIWEASTVKNVLPMTGTPILNKPQELFPQLRLIQPQTFSTLNDYLRDFCYMTENRHWTWKSGAESNIIKKIGHRYIARDRQSAGIIIPPPTPVLHLITKDEFQLSHPLQFKAYEQVRQFAQLVLDAEENISMSMPIFLSVLMRMRQVLAWPAAIELKKKDPDSGIETVIANLNVHESVKLDKAEELIREINEEGERVVLFSQFKAPLKVLKARLGSRVAIYDGDTPDSIRQQIQLDFDPKTVSDHPSFDAVLCNYRAAGEGLNFNAASQMIILDEEWNPGKQSQAYGRIDRLGQTRETTIHTIRVEKTADQWMADLIQEKTDMIDGFETQASLFQKMVDGLKNGDL